LLDSLCGDVHFGLAQNEPKTQEEFNSIGLAAGFTVEPVSSRTDFKQKFFCFGLLLSSVTVIPDYYHLPFSMPAQVLTEWRFWFVRKKPHTIERVTKPLSMVPALMVIGQSLLYRQKGCKNGRRNLLPLKAGMSGA